MDKFKKEYGRTPTEEELTKYDIKLMPVSDLFHKIKEMKKIAARIQGNCFEKEWLKMANDELLLRKVNVRLAYKCLIKRGK